MRISGNFNALAGHFGDDYEPSSKFVPKHRANLFSQKEKAKPLDLVGLLHKQYPVVGNDMPSLNSKNSVEIDINNFDQKALFDLMQIDDIEEKEFFNLLLEDMKSYGSFELSYDPDSDQRKNELANQIRPAQRELIQELAMFYDEYFVSAEFKKPIKALTLLKHLAKEFDRPQAASRIQDLIEANYETEVASKTHTEKEDFQADEAHRKDSELKSKADIKIEANNLKPETELSSKVLAEFAQLNALEKQVFNEYRSIWNQSFAFQDKQEFLQAFNKEESKEKLGADRWRLVFVLAQFSNELDQKDLEAQDTSLVANKDRFIDLLEQARREDLVDKVYSALEK
jgi:hypothetical protein